MATNPQYNQVLSGDQQSLPDGQQPSPECGQEPPPEYGQQPPPEYGQQPPLDGQQPPPQQYGLPPSQQYGGQPSVLLAGAQQGAPGQPTAEMMAMLQSMAGAQQGAPGQPTAQMMAMLQSMAGAQQGAPGQPTAEMMAMLQSMAGAQQGAPGQPTAQMMAMLQSMINPTLAAQVMPMLQSVIVEPAQWMPIPEGVVGYPPGLEYLTQMDQLLVHQQVDFSERFTNWDNPNRYQIKNSIDQQIYLANEESDYRQRGPARGFIMHMTDHNNQEVMRVTREYKCCAEFGVGCCTKECCSRDNSWCACVPSCAMEITVEAPVGTVIGHVRQAPSPWPPKFTVHDANHKTVLIINGPCFACQISNLRPPTADQDFNVMNPDGSTEVGKISKQWGGVFKAATNAANFSVNFPMDLDVKVKATLLGAVFLIDFVYFEKWANNNNVVSAR